MKNLYVKNDNELIYVGYAKEFVYEGETLILVSRTGMFDKVYKPNEFREFIKNSKFILN